MSQSTLSPVEHIKQRSRHLRGSIVDSLANRVTGALADDDTQLIKFHGSYQQDDRDQREERRLAKLEPAYSFMIRTRTPGGVCTPLQWLALDAIAQTYGNGSLRLTTRQAFQFHGVIKRELKATIAAINRSLMDTIAACGDVNRNVMASANPVETRAHGVAYEWAVRLSEHLLPKTRAYAEIWLDGELVTGESGARAAPDATTSGRPEPGDDLVPRAPEHSHAAKSDAPDLEPIYGTTYLPRKFKAAIAVPPINDVDVYAHDLGFIALIEDGVLVGFNVSVGGGLGATHGDPSTYPRRGSVIGSILPEQLLRVAEAVVTTQRDWGNRENRKQSRLKYTIDRVGLDVFKREVEARSGVVLAPERTVVFTQSGDRFGWIVGHDGRWHLNLRIEAGRISDVGEQRWASALRAIAEVHKGDFRITPNQNLIVANVAHGDRAQIDALLAEHGVHDGSGATPLRQRALACVSLPTCPLAMAEAERYLPELLGKIEALLASHSLGAEPISLRITGCPNGCARPYLAEIGLVGKAPGRYNLHLGGDLIGERLNALAHENIDEAQILSALDGWFARYAAERQAGESFGDFTRRVHKELL